MILHFLIANQPIRKYLVKYLSTKDIVELAHIFPQTIKDDTYIFRDIYKILRKNNKLTNNCREKITHWEEFLEENQKVLKLNLHCLSDAIKRNHFDDVVKFCNEGVNINDSLAFFYETALMTACWQKNPKILEYLIHRNADVNLTTDIGNSALHICVLNLSKNCFEVLVKNGANLNQKNNFGNTPLILACENQIYDFAEKLLDNGAFLNEENTIGKTALDYVCENNCLYLAKLFIERGANVHHKNKNGSTVLTSCARSGNYKTMKHLLLNTSAREDVNIKCVEGFTPMHMACYYSTLPVVCLLCMFGAKINVSTNKGLTPLHIAIDKMDIALISFLLSKGAKVENELNSETNIEYNINTPSYSCPNLVGIPPLLLACEKQNLDIVKMLVLTHPNININVFDKYGKTPLMIAVANYSMDIVEFLLLNPNINVNQRDADGRTALFIATRNMNMDIINHLVHNGADFTICDKDGNTPLDMADDLGVKLKTFKS